MPLSSERTITEYARPVEETEIPEIYRDMEEFQGDPAKKIAEEIKHYESHINNLNRYRNERISEGTDPDSPELTEIENSILRMEQAHTDALFTDPNNVQEFLQLCYKSKALINQAKDLETKYKIVTVNYTGK